MIFIELGNNLNRREREKIKEILVLYELIENDHCWMIDEQQYKLAMNQILKEFANVDVSKRTKRDIKIIDMRNDTQPPRWFKDWSENVYENRQPKWFKDWSENVYENKQPRWFKDWSKNQFEPFAAEIKADVAILKTDVADLKVRMTKLETRIDNLVTKNNLIE